MSKLDDLKKIEKGGKAAVIMTIATGLIGLCAKGRKALNNDMDNALNKHDEEIYNNSFGLRKFIMGKPRK